MTDKEIKLLIRARVDGTFSGNTRVLNEGRGLH